MKITSLVLLCLLAVSPLTPRVLFAADDAPTKDDESPICHTAPLRQIEYPPAQLMEGVGQSELRVTTDQPEAQAFFNQGLRMLHGFWAFEAYRAFKQAATVDPDMPMAWWGVYYSTRGSTELESENEAAYEKITELEEGATDHESYYLRLVQHYKEKEGEEQTAAVRSEWEALIEAYPSDIEAKLFLALNLMSGYDEEDRPRPYHGYTKALLRQVMNQQPENAAAHHYWIHAVEESSRPEDGLHSADILTRLAPNVGHLVHMPGHIYYKIGDYERAYGAFAGGRAVDRAYMKKYDIEPVDHWNYAHNINYLVATCAESGRYAEGLELAREVIGIALDAERREANGIVSLFYQGWASLVNLHVRFANWPETIAAVDEMAAKESLLESPYAQNWLAAYRAYAKAMAALDRRDLGAATAAADQFDAALWRYNQDKESGDVPTDRKEDPLFAPYAGQQFDIFSLELRGLIAAHSGQIKEATALLERALEQEHKMGGGDPPFIARSIAESLANVHLAAGDNEAARAAFQDLLDHRPQSGHALYGLARLAAAEDSLTKGNQAEVAQSFERFLHAWRHADDQLPQVLHARSWLHDSATVATAP